MTHVVSHVRSTEKRRGGRYAGFAKRRERERKKVRVLKQGREREREIVGTANRELIRAQNRPGDEPPITYRKSYAHTRA